MNGRYYVCEPFEMAGEARLPESVRRRGRIACGELVERSEPVEQSAQLLSAHSGVVWLRVGLELLPPSKRTDDDGIESRIAHQCRCGIERLRIVAGERDADPIAVAVRLDLQRLVVHRVKCHPPTAGNIAAAHPAEPCGCADAWRAIAPSRRSYAFPVSSTIF